MVNINRVKTENLEKYIEDPEERLVIIMERQRSAYEQAMADRDERNRRIEQAIANGEPITTHMGVGEGARLSGVEPEAPSE